MQLLLLHAHGELRGGRAQGYPLEAYDAVVGQWIQVSQPCSHATGSGPSDSDGPQLEQVILERTSPSSPLTLLRLRPCDLTTLRM